MDKDALALTDLSGSNVESGAALLKKFKRVSVTGGSLRGARYSDVSESDIRKAARQYRGDARSDPRVEKPSQQQQPSKSDECKAMTSWFKLVIQHVKGRWLTFGLLVGFLILIMSRPSFGKLCGRMIGLTLRVILRRVVGLLLVVIDSILDEVADQFELALLTSPEVAAVPASPAAQQSYSGYPQFALSCIRVSPWSNPAPCNSERPPYIYTVRGT